MNGGTLATNITQTYSLINTTGVIEKDKNIYYAPRFAQSDLGKKIYTAFLEKFLSVTSSARPSEYQDVSLSQWSPEDRTLKVKGMPDDFRCNSSYGYALNYLLIKRTITKGEEESQDLYYGFFIDSARQVGVGTVSLDVTPDDLTNAFYLLNMDTIGSADYEPFNNKLSNCFVERQHYDRFKKYTYTKYGLTEDPSDFMPHSLAVINRNDVANSWQGDKFGITALDGELTYGFYENNAYTVVHGRELMFARKGSFGRYYFAVELDGVEYPLGLDDSYVILANRNKFSEGYFASPEYILYEASETEVEGDTYTTANERLFINTEESYTFKEQHKDFKSPMSPFIQGTYLTQAELNEIKEVNSFSELRKELQRKVLILSMKAVRLTISDPDVIVKNMIRVQVSADRTEDLYIHYEPNEEWLSRTSLKKSYAQVDVPIYMPPKELEKFRYDFKDLPLIGYKISTGDPLNDYDYTIVPNFPETSPIVGSLQENLGRGLFRENSPIDTIDKEHRLTNDVSQVLSSGAFAQYIMSAQIVSNPPFMKYVEFMESTYYLTMIINMTLKESNCSLRQVRIAGKTPEGETFEEEKGYGLFFKDTFNDYRMIYDSALYGVLMGISINTDENSELADNVKRYINLPIIDLNSSDIKTKYIDPVLEQEPYSMYVLTRLGLIDSPLMKKRYWEMKEYKNYTIPLYFIQSFNEAYKTSIVPIYKLDGFETPYYNEALTVTLSSSLPIRKDSYETFIYNNKAQMANQYALIEYNGGIDFLQTKYITGVGQVAKGWLMGAGGGALAGGISATVDTINSLIDWEQSKETTRMSQQAKKSDMGSIPDNYKQAGSDIYFDIFTGEHQEYLVHYNIDKVSHDSICKLLERLGYVVNIYDSLNVLNRKGWNYIKLHSFDFNAYLNANQEVTIKNIMTQGVTLVHEPVMLEQGQHNYETILDE